MMNPATFRKNEPRDVRNYFNYYTEIEEHFQQRRGTLLMLSTLDWSLIATWQEAGFPLEAVLAGIDATFDKHAARQARGRVRRINGLAYCAQEVLRAVEDMHEAATGASRKDPTDRQDSGFENIRIAEYLRAAAAQLRGTQEPVEALPVLSEATVTLEEIAQSLESSSAKSEPLETLERRLITLEDRVFAAFQTFTPAENLLALREQSARELAPYRSRLDAAQIRQIEQQFLRRSLFEQYCLPRLSLFYMRQS